MATAAEKRVVKPTARRTPARASRATTPATRKAPVAVKAMPDEKTESTAMTAVNESVKAVKLADKKPEKAKKRDAEKPANKEKSKGDGKKAGNSNEKAMKSARVNIGIPPKQLDQIAEGLSRLLADTYTLYLKTHNFHWNVTGPMFNSLHQMFETQYTELALAVDSIAERIRTLGYPAPGTYKAYAKLSSIKEEDGVPEATDMIRQLMADQETVVRTARAIFPVVDEANDEPTADLLTQRMQVHEKTAWMLRSLLD